MNVVEKIKAKTKLKKKLGNKCVYCDCNNKLLLTIDHKMPKSRGGKDDDTNKQVCCWFCNQLKGSLTDNEFKKYLKSLYTLKELCKVRLKFPDNLDVMFNANHYPDFKLPIRIQPIPKTEEKK
jgi:hypothetical protein